MEPAPVGIKHDLAIDGGAGTIGSARLPGHLGMGLGRLGADLLGAGGRHKGGDGSGTIHPEGITRSTRAGFGEASD